MKIFKSLFITLFFMLFFIGTANADTCISSYNSNWETNTSFTVSSDPGQIHRNVKFDNAISLDTQYDYIKIPFYVVSLSTNNIISNINLYESCTTATNVFDNYTITYADGTKATIDADNYRTICNQYKINGTAVVPYTPYISTTNINLYTTNNGRINCELDNNLVAKCKLPKNQSSIAIMGYIIDTYLNNQSSTIRAGIVNGVIQYCNDSDTQIIEQQQETNNNLNKIDTSINSSNTSGGESAADDLKNNSAFQDNSGLSSVVSMPLTFVNSLSNTCQPISLNIPYFDVDIQIPCLQSIITEKMPALANILKVVINGFIIYRVLLDIFQIIRNAKNPEDDRIEVLDL